MPASVVDLNGPNVIEANSLWSMDVLHPGNFSRARLKGQIRKGYGGELLAEFKVETPTYNAETDQTRFRVFLRSQETEKIPVPPPGQFWIYDLMLQLPSGDFQRLLKGKVFVDPGVTDV